MSGAPDQVNMALDDIIKKNTNSKRGNGNRRREGGGATAGAVRRNTRDSRSSKPYDESSKPSRRSRRDNLGSSRPRSPGSENSVILKCLLSKAVAGLVIGKGGANIRKFIENTGAYMNSSAQGELYPGTPLRVLQVDGTEEAVSLAAAILLEVIALEGTNADLSAKVCGYRVEAVMEFD